MIRANCRNSLTADDFQFIGDVLAKSSRQKNVLTDLLSDGDVRDAILDDEQLLQAVLSHSELEGFSAFLYFYLLTRRAFLEKHIDNREITDYVASLLVKFCSSQRLHNPTKYHDENYHYLVDMMADFVEASPIQAFYLRSHVGNYALFITGIFPDYIYRKSTYGRKAPGLAYYEKMGQSSYQWAAQHRLALEYHLNDILIELAEKFKQIRLALNHLVDQYLNLDSRENSLDKMLRQIFYGRDNDMYLDE